MTRAYVRIILLHGAAAALRKAHTALVDGPDPNPDLAMIVRQCVDLVGQVIRSLVDGQMNILKPSDITS